MIDTTFYSSPRGAGKIFEYRNRVLLLALENNDEFLEGFYDWLYNNFHIYEEFAKRAIQIATKRDHYSARTIIEVMRHDSIFSENGGEFKISNNRSPDLARLFALSCPSYKDLFSYHQRSKAE